MADEENEGEKKEIHKNLSETQGGEVTETKPTKLTEDEEE